MSKKERDALILEWVRVYIYDRKNVAKKQTIEFQLKELGVTSIQMMYMSEDYFTTEYVEGNGRKIKQFRQDEIYPTK